MLITGGATNDLEQQLAEGLGFVEGHHTPSEVRKLRSRSRVSLLPMDEGILEPFNVGRIFWMQNILFDMLLLIYINEVL